MAGVGPPPKDPSTRARRNKPPELRIVPIEPVQPPELPEVMVHRTMPDGSLGLVPFEWPERTRVWWKKWHEDWPPSHEFSALDWEYLLDTAMLHAAMWRGNIKVAGELRLRVAAFGVTPADRARLRMTLAIAEEIESRSGGGKGKRSAKQRYRGLGLSG